MIFHSRKAQFLTRSWWERRGTKQARMMHCTSTKFISYMMHVVAAVTVMCLVSRTRGHERI